MGWWWWWLLSSSLAFHKRVCESERSYSPPPPPSNYQCLTFTLAAKEEEGIRREREQEKTVPVFARNENLMTCRENNNGNEYISKALNPPVSNLHRAQSAVHVQLKLSKLHIRLKPNKERNQRRQNTTTTKKKKKES